jgi:hypothetical protein
MTDRPIHLAGLSITKKAPHTEDSVTLPIWITQSTLDGLFELMRFLGGMHVGGLGQIPGEFELIMFYRTIHNAIYEAERTQPEPTASCEI